MNDRSKAKNSSNNNVFAKKKATNYNDDDEEEEDEGQDNYRFKAKVVISADPVKSSKRVKGKQTDVSSVIIDDSSYHNRKQSNNQIVNYAAAYNQEQEH